MKIIFLDFDGVLNSIQYDRVRTENEGNIDETRMPLLKRIVDETGAVIVLSTSWRKHWEAEDEKLDEIGRWINETFDKFGMSIFDKTPLISASDRALEVRTWLGEHGDNVSSFVILDDIALGWGELADNLVKTDYRMGRGLEEGHVTRAIEILGAKD